MLQGKPEQEQEQGWAEFVFRPQMLPFCLVDKALAEKILFIGKSMRILRSLNERDSLFLPEESLLLLVQSLREYEPSNFRITVESLRKELAHRLLHVVI